MTYKYISYLKKHYKVALLVSLGSFFVFLRMVNAKEAKDTTHEIFKYPAAEIEVVSEDVLEEIFVDVKGNVNNPGVYQMQEGDRVIDAVLKAEGLSSTASTQSVNLAKRITDEMVIIIPSIDQEIEVDQTKEIVLSEDSNLLNINTATSDELTSLPKIGTAKAEDIINYRNINGNFKVIDDLKKVSGIGESIYNEIKNLITI